jgi:hypothetical protein
MSELSMAYYKDAKPSLIMKHIDGPLLYLRDGRMHWLTWRERFRVWLGLDDALSLERKLWNMPWNKL